MPRTRKRKRSSQNGSFFGGAAKWLFVAGLWAGIFLVVLTAWYAQELPRITKEAEFGRKLSITIEAADGSVIARYGEIRGNSVAVEDMPPYLPQAVVAIEDRRFYSHFGIDPLGIMRAMVVNVTRGRVVQGGSTITQQLAKNLFLSQERTFKRKVQEAMLALWLEHELSKDEILAAYMNRVYMGAGTYGVAAAARVYFDKDVKDVTLRESAMLAGLLKAPSRYSPTNNPDLARRRAEVVLAAMVKSGYLKEDEASGVFTQTDISTEKPGHIDAVRYYTDWIVDGVDEMIGTPDQDIIVRTTLIPSIQKTAESSLVASLEANGVEKNITQGATIVMDPNGAILAMIGGKNYSESQFNRATQAKRPPGSSFKPVVYLTALEHGWSPEDLVVDEPFTTGRYRPENFGGEYFGEVTLEEALLRSLNTVSVTLARRVGIESVVDMARRLGIYSPLQPDLSLALGSSGVSLLEMVVAYGTLANEGYAVYPYGIKSIKGKDDYIYYQRRNERNTRSVVSSFEVQKLAQMMTSVVQYGTGQAAQGPYPAAGKTGTSQDSRDAWFMGFNDRLVIGVWMGNDDNSPMKSVTGGTFPARVWRDIMTASYPYYRPENPGRGPSLVSAFDTLLGKIISSQPEDDRYYYEQQYVYDRSEIRQERDTGRKLPGTSHYNE